ncbi:hypothetical protein G6F62_009485 [Rhizopus arrhizus]|uniref:Dilute domain-containing protein n=1 Tax=Rhizopus oryzae TaxID=64495 RepID=A0A9P7BVI3_RHIOR|nr:hypothetical protein G6F24_011996 [Rhizopus arrhizus]KAG0913015.1 hypothetical protein G6F33_005561 [Rhizopus arrhizus]KAG0931174.1 hypothetical protein G6F32_011765 [Rhizopus arrhizus]KAG1280554.1 hypothetical protein G6F66_011580 [Rhizopus arrhizus]KAG1312222.1 hypothetical protein G6F64_003200 [Rhizopus arrhizus]
MITKTDTILSTPPPEQTEDVRKQYENMSYDEMSQRIAESYKQLSELLGNRISLPSTISTSTTVDDADDYDENVIERQDMDDGLKRQKCTKLFLKSASSGDLEKVLKYLETMKPFIDINAKDEDGTTPLIYAACFGKFEIAQALLTAGAKIDSQDSHGWTALMWATTNNHESLVKLLLEHGASSQTKSAKGRTVFDFVKNDTNKIADILANNPRNSVSSTTSSVLGLTAVESISSVVSKDHYYPYEENYESLLNLDNENRPKLIEEYLMTNEEEKQQQQQLNEEEEEEEEEEELKEVEFDWDRCMPDQMFVFSADDLPYILDTVITKLTLPVRNVQEIFLPANVIFLSARYAHHYSGSELAEEVMEGALGRISKAIKSNTENVHILSYWITNITRLLYYLKKDAGFATTTAEYQLRISELILETYTFMIQDTEKRLGQILEMAMLEYDPITGIEQVNFSDDWQRFFRRKSNNTEMQRNSSNISNISAPDTKIISPESITTLLSCTLYVLQSYEVHSTIIIQALAQFFHFMSCELFNHILTKKKYLCRSKAVQFRMNLAELEEWIRNNRLPSNLLSYLKPTIQLVQLLQCISHLDTLESMDMFDALNTLQIRRCITNYRYETNEQKISNEIQMTIDHRPSRTFDRSSKIVEEIEEEEQEEEETKDSKFMLPFFVPTAAQLSVLNEKISPAIPQDWMERLDKISSMTTTIS